MDEIKIKLNEPNMNLTKEDCLTRAFRKGGKLYTGVELQQLTLLEKPF